MSDDLSDAKEMLGKGYSRRKYYDPLDDALDRPIAFNPAFKRITKSTNAALFMAQVWYWSKRTKDKDGWFYKTSEEWQEETALTRDEIIGARKVCRSLDVVEEKLKGVPATLFYRINKAKVYELLGVQFTEIPETGLPEDRQFTEKQESGEDVNINKNTEITAGNTAKADVAEMIKAANETVDAILKSYGLAAGKSWTRLPEMYHPYGKVFCAATGLTYAKSDLYKWMPVFETWEVKGHTPQFVLDAIQEIKSEGKAGQISGPSSITWKLEAMAVARNARQEKAAGEEEKKTIPPSWQHFYEEPQHDATTT